MKLIISTRRRDHFHSDQSSTGEWNPSREPGSIARLNQPAIACGRTIQSGVGGGCSTCPPERNSHKMHKACALAGAASTRVFLPTPPTAIAIAASPRRHAGRDRARITPAGRLPAVGDSLRPCNPRRDGAQPIWADRQGCRLRRRRLPEGRRYSPTWRHWSRNWLLLTCWPYVADFSALLQIIITPFFAMAACCRFVSSSAPTASSRNGEDDAADTARGVRHPP